MVVKPAPKSLIWLRSTSRCDAQLVSLLTGVLARNVCERLGAEEALRHPWAAADGWAPLELRDMAAMSSGAEQSVLQYADDGPRSQRNSPFDSL